MTGGRNKEEDTAVPRFSSPSCSSPALPPVPSPTPCTSRLEPSRSPSLSPASNHFLTNFTPSNALQMLLLEATKDESMPASVPYAGPSGTGDGRHAEEASVSTDVGIGRLGLLLSPDEDPQAKYHQRAVRGQVQKSKFQLPAVTPTLSRHPGVPPVTPTIAGVGKRQAAGSFRTAHVAEIGYQGESRGQHRDKRNSRVTGRTLMAAGKGDDEIKARKNVEQARSGEEKNEECKANDDESRDQQDSTAQYPGFFQQVRELQARGLLTAEQGNQLCERALLGDKRLAALYKERKRRHLEQGVRPKQDAKESKKVKAKGVQKGAGYARRESPAGSGARELSRSDWRDFASALKLLI